MTVDVSPNDDFTCLDRLEQSGKGVELYLDIFRRREVDRDKDNGATVDGDFTSADITRRQMRKEKYRK